MKRIWIIFLCLFFMVSGVQGEGDFCEGSVLKKYCEGIIGNWCIGDSLYIITSEYVLCIPGKRMKCSYSKEVKGKLFMYEVMPSKTFYAISKEGGYIFRAMRWYRIEGEGEDMVLDNRKFLFRVGPVKVFSFDGGGVLRKISDEEVIGKLAGYELDYDVIRKLPIETHQRVPAGAVCVYDTERKYNLKGRVKVEDDSLPNVIEKFLLQRGK